MANIRTFWVYAIQKALFFLLQQNKIAFSSLFADFVCWRISVSKWKIIDLISELGLL